MGKVVTTKDTVETAKKMVEVLNHLKSKTFMSRTHFKEELIKSECPYYSKLTSYLFDTKEIVENVGVRSGCWNFVSHQPYYFGNFIVLLDRWRKERSIKRTKGHNVGQIDTLESQPNPSSLSAGFVKGDWTGFYLSNCLVFKYPFIPRPSRWVRFWVKFFFGLHYKEVH